MDSLITERDKREFQRFGKSFNLRINEFNLYAKPDSRKQKQNPHDGKTLNISANGALIESDKSYPEHTLLNLSIDMPEWEKYKSSFFSSMIVFPCPPLDITAEVVRKDSAYGANKRFAVRFVGVDSIKQKAVDKMLKDFEQRSN